MARSVAGVVGGFVAWFIVATLLNFPLRWWLPGYVEAESPMTFTLPMLMARLAIGVLASFAAGYALAMIARRAGRVALALGIALVALFVPIHYGLWDKFPVWYHAMFVVSLVPFVLLGARMAARRMQGA